MGLGRLEQRTTPDAVSGVLRSAILTGELLPGSALREMHIAGEMGISRAPVREALSKLEEEGLVVKIPFRGSFVAQVSPDTVREISGLRLHVEPYAVERSLPALLGPARDELERSLADLEDAVAARDIPASIDAHLALHRLFYIHADHALLLAMWTTWEAQLRLFLAVGHQSVGHLEHIVQAHVRLHDAIVSGDTDLIAEELHDHILEGFPNLDATPGGDLSLESRPPPPDPAVAVGP